MPTVKDGPLKGLRADICLNPLGVVGRMNPAQNFEQESSFIGLYVRKKMKDYLEAGDIDSALDEYLIYISKLGTEMQYNDTIEYINTLAEDEDTYADMIVELLCENIERGIPVNQYPFEHNMDFFDLCDVYEFYEDRYDIPDMRVTFDGIMNPTTIGELYFVKLKHSSDNKSSMRSTGFVDLLDLPSKDRRFKELKSLYPNTPIKWGEQECINCLIPRDSTAIKEMVNSYGTSYEDEELLEYNLLSGNPFYTDIKFPLTKSKPSLVKDKLMYGLGLELVNEDDEVDDEVIEALEKSPTRKKKKK